MRRWLLATMFVAFGIGGSARAGLVVTIPNVTITSGGPGTVATLDVMIRADGYDAQGNPSDPVGNPSPTPVALAVAGYGFVITPGNNANNPALPSVSLLSFVDPQDESYESAAEYVFKDTSSNVFFGGSGSVSTDPGTPGVNNRYDGGDSSLDPGTFALTDVMVTGDKLLIRLQLQFNSLAVDGDTFTLALVPPTGGQYDGGGPSDATFFASAQQYNDDNDNATRGSTDYTSNTATITVRLSAVPEPSSLALAATAFVGAMFPVVRRLRKTA